MSMRSPRGEPVTASEVARWMERHEREASLQHREMMQLIQRLDDRTDRINLRVTVIFAVVSVLWAIFLVLAPFLRIVLGLPNA